MHCGIHFPSLQSHNASNLLYFAICDKSLITFFYLISVVVLIKAILASGCWFIVTSKSSSLCNFKSDVNMHLTGRFIKTRAQVSDTEIKY